jgi:hypothetical protein
MTAAQARGQGLYTFFALSSGVGERQKFSKQPGLQPGDLTIQTFVVHNAAPYHAFLKHS